MVQHVWVILFFLIPLVNGGTLHILGAGGSLLWTNMAEEEKCSFPLPNAQGSRGRAAELLRSCDYHRQQLGIRSPRLSQLLRPLARLYFSQPASTGLRLGLRGMNTHSTALSFVLCITA